MRFSQILLVVMATVIAAERSTCNAADHASLVAKWSFGTEETSRLSEHGNVNRDQAGPREPEFPDFEKRNTAVKFSGDGAHFSIADSGTNSPFDFTNGDGLTVEAWVNVDSIGQGEYRYVIGKGRTGAEGFARDNQNWALRVTGSEGLVRVNFLFATEFAVDQTTPDAHWHRWTTTTGFLPGTGWHHIAVVYKFGQPDSIRGFIDGRVRDGAWDMGGPTTQAPMNDNDEVWIGSSQGGRPGNSFKGALDEVAVYREAMSDSVMSARFRRVGPERPEPQLIDSVPELPEIPHGQVLVLFRERVAAHDHWMNISQDTAPTSRWESFGFIIPRLPYRYDDWGVRDGWSPPVLIQAAAEVAIPAGRHRLLLRSRGMSRLWIDGKVVARTKPHGGSSDGHEPVQSVPDLPAPGHHAVGFGDQEVIVDLHMDSDRNCRIILESVAGSKSLRAEPGETVVALQRDGQGVFEILRPSGETSPALSLLESDFLVAMDRAKQSLSALDDLTRRSLSASQDDFWAHRHQLARRWVDEHPGPVLSALSGNPIDRFIEQKIQRLSAASTGGDRAAAESFHNKVMPILRDNCLRCHGEKVKGGLRLNTLAAATQGGDSGQSAILPGNPQESYILERMRATAETERMPPGGAPLRPEQIAIIENWIKDGAIWSDPLVSDQDVAMAPVVDDASFLRRVYLDTVGVPPSEPDARAFLSSEDPKKREVLIERLLRDDRLADHWVSYWQDVLAENPNMLKPSLNNSGPFRFFLYESLRDGKAIDRMVTELIMMRGSEREGGSAGFGLAADNDSPMAAKGHILAGAFLGVELQCAKCHDSPYHSTKQKDLYSLAAMLSRKTLTVPTTSTVSPGFFEKNKLRESLIQVTLKPGEPIAPEWPFGESISTASPAELASLVQKVDDSRERLSALVTAPQNERFAQVIVNRVWKRLIGAGLVEPAHDWEGRIASHPELLAWLAKQLVSHDYDLKHVMKLIFSSQLYQRQTVGSNLTTPAERRLFTAPDRRRLSAEQIVDSLYTSSGHAMEVEEITFDPDGRRPASSMINLGAPTRAWMFASLSNERDRPSLSLPKAQLVSDILEAFGWIGSRQNPRTDRESEPTVLQPGVLANSVVVTWLAKASTGSELANLAVQAESASHLIDALYLRFLSRLPTADERQRFQAALEEGFMERVDPIKELKRPEIPRLGRVSWSNHLAPEANSIKIEMERQAREGAPPDPRLRSQWREVYEDLVWSIINSPELVWIP